MPSVRGISSRITLAVVAALVAAAGLANAFLLESDRRRELAQLRLEGERTAEQLATNLAYPLWNLVKAPAEEDLAQQARWPGVRAILVADEAGQPFVGVVKDRAGQVRTYLPERDAGLLADTERIVRPVLHEATPVGTVTVHLTTEPVREITRARAVGSFLGVLAVAVALGLSLVVALRTLVVTPLGRLRGWVDRAAAVRDVPPPPRASAEEIDALAHAFGELVVTRAAAEREVARSEAFFRAIQERSPDLAVVIGKDRRYKFVSAARTAVLGYTVEESLARTPLDLIHPDEAPRIAKAIERVREDTGAVARLRYRVRHKDGTWRTLDVVARNELDNPDVGGVLVNARDVTEQVQLAARLEQVREEEKSRIARDLHDQLGQLLTGLKLDLLWLEERLEAMEPTPVVRSLVERAVAASALSEQTVTEVQRIATDLRPAALDRLGLGAALQQEGRRFEARARVACRVELSEPLPPLPATRATALYRIAQEALTNVARHARAGQVVVRLEAAAGEVTLTVDDDGVGLEPSRAGHSEALGLAGMRERAELEGGELVLSGRPGGGTRVAARLPLHPGEEGGP